MDRINGADTTDIGGGRRGFRDENLVTGTAGTVVTALHLNSMQEEVLKVITEAGLVPSDADWTQLWQALQILGLASDSRSRRWLAVNSMTLSSAPGAPAAGDTYLIPTGATGIWATHVGAIAHWGGSSWSYLTPPDGHGISLPDGRIFERIAGTYVQKVALDVQSGKWTHAIAAGTVNALTAAFTPAIAAYTDGMAIRVRAASTNTAAYTLDAGAGAKSVVRYDGSPSQAGDRLPGVTAQYVFDAVADAWRLTTMATRQGGQQVYDVAGTYPWVVPDGVTEVEVEVWGGGGGSGACNGLTHNCGGTGAGGGYTKKRIRGLVPGSTVTASVGAGGVGGTISPLIHGGTGGTSSFGPHCSATGGTGGQTASGALPSNAGLPGDGTGGDVNIKGGNGGLYWVGNGGAITYAPPGNAYGNPFRQPGSGDGNGSVATNAGDAGTAGVTATGASRNGGAGAPGKIIIRY